MRFRWMLILLALACGVSARGVARAGPLAPRGIVGRVTDPAGKPLRGALVVLLPDSVRTTTGGDGVFVIAHPPAGAYSLWVIRSDYMPAWVQLDGRGPADSLTIELRPVAELAANRPPDAELAARAAQEMETVEEVRVYRLHTRFMDPLPAGRDVPGVGLVTQELKPLDAGRRAWLARLVRRAGAADCAADPGFREAAATAAARRMLVALQRTTVAVAVMDGPAPLVLELTDDGRVCALRRNGQDLANGLYHMECVADSLRMLMVDLLQSEKAAR